MKHLRKKLRRFADLIADQAERNPDFAEAISNILDPLSSPEKENIKTTEREITLDPFEIYRSHAPEKFRDWLNGLTIHQLRSIVRQHRLDPSRLSDKWKNKERFITLISERVEARSTQGDVFRHYGVKDTDAKLSNHDTKSA
jgi:hypothetical protein